MAPSPARLFTVILPPWLSTNFDTIASPQPNAIGFRGEERIEDVLELIFLDPDSRIGDFDLRHRAIAAGPNHESSSRRHCLVAVQQQVQHDAFDQGSVKRKPRNVVQVLPNLNVFLAAFDLLHELGNGSADDVIQVCRFLLQRRRAGKIQEPRDQFIRAVNFAANESGTSRATLFSSVTFFSRISADADITPSGFLIFVRQPGRKLSQRGQPLGR